MLRLVVIAGLMVVFSPSHSCELHHSYFIPQKILQTICDTFCNTRTRILFPHIQEMNNKASNIFCGMCPPKNNTTTTKAPSRPAVTKPATSTPSLTTVTKSEASTSSTTATPPTSTTSQATSTTTENAEKQAETETTTSP